MTERAIGSLYDALHALEARWRTEAVYPVHKMLRFETADTEDIYDWIMSRVDPPEYSQILDAGCGVGFGAIRLAKRRACSVTGISLSENEVASALRSAARLGVDNTVEFRCQSFDTLPQEAYDVVLAVESLKHSNDLRLSLQSLVRSVRPRGSLAVVEDLFTGNDDDALARSLIKDWGLKALYREADYLAHLDASRCQIFDLTGHVRRAGTLGVAIRLRALGVLLKLVGATTAMALRAFRGGLALERMYANGAMAYKVIVCRPAGPARC